MKRLFCIGLIVSCMLTLLTGCSAIDKIKDKFNRVDGDKDLYRAIAASDELIVVHEDGEYQVRVINGTGDDIVTSDYTFSSKWTVSEDFSIDSYNLTNDGNGKFGLAITSFGARVSGAHKNVQPLDGESLVADAPADPSESAGSVQDGDIVPEAPADMKTHRIVCTGYSDESENGFEVYTADGSYLVRDEPSFRMIEAAYDHGIKRFYADCEMGDDSYLGVIVTPVFSKPEQAIINEVLADYLGEDFVGKGITEDGQVGDMTPQMPENAQPAEIVVLDHIEEVRDGHTMYMIIDDAGATYYVLTDDMYNTIIEKSADGQSIDIEWGVDASGYNVITYVN